MPPTTVIEPSLLICQGALTTESFVLSQASRFSPLKRTTASEGTLFSSKETTSGSGSQTSVASGSVIGTSSSQAVVSSTGAVLSSLFFSEVSQEKSKPAATNGTINFLFMTRVF